MRGAASGCMVHLQEASAQGELELNLLICYGGIS